MSKRNPWSSTIVSVLWAFVVAVSLLAQAHADPGDRSRLGKAGDWKNTVAGAALGNQLYTVESSGILYVTDLSSGTWKQIGKPLYANTRFLFAAAPNLYTITAGSLYRVNTATGGWTRLGKANDWKGTIAGTVLNGQLYTVEQSGLLYNTNLSTGVWKQIGKAEFGNTRHIFAAGNSLYNIETDGHLYKVNPADGSWKPVGQAADWKGTVAGTMLAGMFLYTADKNGMLYMTEPDSGTRTSVGKGGFGATTHLLENGLSVYMIDGDGSLYRVEGAPLAG